MSRLQLPPLLFALASAIVLDGCGKKDAAQQAPPPAEVGVHPDEGPTWESGTRHQFTFMCDKIDETIADLKAKGVEVLGDRKEERYGITVTLNLPGDCKVMMYEPHHPIAAGM